MDQNKIRMTKLCRNP